MLTKLCARCKKVVEYPNTYCERCRPIVKKEREETIKRSSNRYNKQRNKKYTQFYNSKEWRTLSKLYMSKHKMCEECQKLAIYDKKYLINIAEEVHHKQPIQTQTGWLRRLDYTNLIALCHEHHDIKHERFKKKI